MEWARILAYITGTVDHELLLRNEYLAAENRILRGQLKGRLKFSDARFDLHESVRPHAARKLELCFRRNVVGETIGHPEDSLRRKLFVLVCNDQASWLQSRTR